MKTRTFYSINKTGVTTNSCVCVSTLMVHPELCEVHGQQ
jgi:hypothetical protein